MTNTNTVHKIARHYLDAAIADNNAYEAEVLLWNTEGDGRPVSEGGRGYSFPYCRHGVSQWTDYDCACGWCEDEGFYFDWFTAARSAISRAKSDVRESNRRLDMVSDLNILDKIIRSGRTEAASKAIDALVDWCVEPVRI